MISAPGPPYVVKGVQYDIYPFCSKCMSSLIAFGKALYDHVTNPQQTSLEQVRMKHDAWTKDDQTARENVNKLKMVYEELHDAPRKQDAHLYEQYLQEKQAAFDQYMQTKSETDRRNWLSIQVPAEIASKGVHHDFVFTTDRLFNKVKEDD